MSRIVSRYFREFFRVRAGKIILEHGFFIVQFQFFPAENCNCICKINLRVNAVSKNRFQRRYY